MRPKSQGSRRSDGWNHPRTADAKAGAAAHAKKVRRTLIGLEDGKGLTPGQRRVWEALVGLFSRHKGEIHPSNRMIAKRLEMSERFVSRARAKLVKLGLIVVVSHAKGGRGMAPVLRLGRTAMDAIGQAFRRLVPSFVRPKTWNESPPDRGVASNASAERDSLSVDRPVEVMKLPELLHQAFWAELRRHASRQACELLGWPLTSSSLR
ncbi:helix-turn-helix domain-containing protein [Acuticoccus kandeliae]|uniref:helix-turn-helix domain-containing protein n=1 Tax=Acuticoccus kandeliae TaxID=2073160 RepID=UPI0013005F6A|nr:helix-turn-helix domain-containing protein [Acuticoccus kandeliae]